MRINNITTPCNCCTYQTRETVTDTLPATLYARFARSRRVNQLMHVLWHRLISFLSVS